MWGFGDMDGRAGTNLPQYPAPTLIVTEGQAVTINVTNWGVPDTLPTAHRHGASGPDVIRCPSS